MKVPVEQLDVPDNTVRVRLITQERIAESVVTRHALQQQPDMSAVALQWHWTFQRCAQAAQQVLHTARSLADVPLDLHYVNIAHEGRYRLFESPLLPQSSTNEDATASPPPPLLLFDIYLRVTARYQLVWCQADTGEPLVLQCAHVTAPVRWTHWCGGGPMLADVQRVSAQDFHTKRLHLRAEPTDTEALLALYRDQVPSAGYVFAEQTQRTLSVDNPQPEDSGLYVAESEGRVLGVFDVQVVGTPLSTRALLSEWRAADDAQRFSRHTVHFRDVAARRQQPLVVVRSEPAPDARSLGYRWYVCPVPAALAVADHWPHSLVHALRWRDDHRAIGYLDLPVDGATTTLLTVDTEQTLIALANGVAPLDNYEGGALVLLAFEEYEPREPWPTHYVQQSDAPVPFSGDSGATVRGARTVHEQVHLLRRRHATLDQLLVPLGADTMWVAPASSITEPVADLSAGRLQRTRAPIDLTLTTTTTTAQPYANVGARARLRTLRHAALLVFDPRAPADIAETPPQTLQQQQQPSVERMRALCIVDGSESSAAALAQLVGARNLVERDADSLLARTVDCRVRAELSALRMLWYVSALAHGGGAPARWFEGQALLHTLGALRTAPELVDVALRPDGTAMVRPSAERSALSPLQVELPLFSADSRQLDDSGATVLYALCSHYGYHLLARSWPRPLLGARFWPEYDAEAERRLWTVRPENARALVELHRQVAASGQVQCVGTSVASERVSLAAAANQLRANTSLDELRTAVQNYWSPDMPERCLVDSISVQQAATTMAAIRHVTLETLLVEATLRIRGDGRERQQYEASLARTRRQQAHITRLALSWRLGEAAPSVGDRFDAVRQRVRAAARRMFGVDALAPDKAGALRQLLGHLYAAYRDSCLLAIAEPQECVRRMDEIERYVARYDGELRSLYAWLEALQREHERTRDASHERDDRALLEQAKRDVQWQLGVEPPIRAYYDSAVDVLFAHFVHAVDAEKALLEHSVAAEHHARWSPLARMRFAGAVDAYRRALDTFQRRVDSARDAGTQMRERIENAAKQALLAHSDTAAAKAVVDQAVHDIDTYCRAQAARDADALQAGLAVLRQQYASHLDALRHDADLWEDLPNDEQLDAFAKQALGAAAEAVDRIRVPPPAAAGPAPPQASEDDENEPRPRSLDADFDPDVPAPAGFARALTPSMRDALCEFGRALATQLQSIEPHTSAAMRTQLDRYWSVLMRHAYLCVGTPAQSRIAEFVLPILGAVQHRQERKLQRWLAWLLEFWGPPERTSIAARYEEMRLDRAPYERFSYEAHAELAAIAVTASMESRVPGSYQAARKVRTSLLAERGYGDAVRALRSMRRFYRGIFDAAPTVNDAFLVAYGRAFAQDWSATNWKHDGSEVDAFLAHMDALRTNAFRETAARIAHLTHTRQQRMRTLASNVITLLAGMADVPAVTSSEPTVAAASALPVTRFIHLNDRTLVDPLPDADVRVPWVRTLDTATEPMTTAAYYALGKLALYEYARTHLGMQKPQRAGDVIEYVLRNRVELMRRHWQSEAQQQPQQPFTALVAPLGSPGAKPLVADSTLAQAVRSGLVDSTGASRAMRSIVFDQLFLGDTPLLGVRELPRRADLDALEYARQLESQLVAERALLVEMFDTLKLDGMRLLCAALFHASERPLLRLRAPAGDDVPCRASALAWRYAIQATERITLAHYTGAPRLADNNLFAAVERLFGRREHNSQPDAVMTALLSTHRQRLLEVHDRTADDDRPVWHSGSALTATEPRENTEPIGYLVERTLFTDWYDTWMHIADPGQTLMQHRTLLSPVAGPIEYSVFADNNLWPDDPRAAVSLLPPLPWPETFVLANEFRTLQHEMVQLRDRLGSEFRVVSGTAESLLRELTPAERRDPRALQRRVDAVRVELDRLRALVERAREFVAELVRLDVQNTDMAVEIERTQIKSDYTPALAQDRDRLHDPSQRSATTVGARDAPIAEAAFARTLSKLNDEAARLDALRERARTNWDQRQALTRSVEGLVRQIQALGVDEPTKLSLNVHTVMSFARAESFLDDLTAEKSRLEAVLPRAQEYSSARRVLAARIGALRTTLGNLADAAVRQYRLPERVRPSQFDATLDRLRDEQEQLEALEARESQFGHARILLHNAVAGIQQASVLDLNSIV